MNLRMTKPFRVLLNAVFVLVSLLMLIPMLIMMKTSVQSMGSILAGESLFALKRLHFENYVQAFTRGKWLVYLYNSLFVTFFTVLISLCINSLAGFAFARLHFRFREALFVASLIGLLIPPQATIVPVFMILKNFPLAGGNGILGRGGTGFLNTKFGIMAPYLAGSFGVFMFRQFFLNFPRSLDDAANIDGLTRVGSFWYIYIPLSKPVFSSLIVLKATSTWNEYAWPLIVTLSDKNYTLQLALVYFRDEIMTQWNLLMAATCVIIAPLVVLFMFAQRAFVTGIATTGIKG